MITFDEASHTYRDGMGQIVPSVTFMLRSVGVSPPIPRFRSVLRAMERGSAIHRAIHLFSTASLDVPSMRPEYMGWFEAFLSWYGQCGLKRMKHEIIVEGEGTRYVGRVDLIGQAGEEELTIDFKTGAEAEWHEIQVTLYALARNREKGKGLRRALVYLRRDGSWKQVDVKGAATVTDALAVVRVFDIGRAARMKALQPETESGEKE